MLKPERMRHAMIVVQNKDRRSTIAALADARAMHIVDHEKTTISKTPIDIGSPEEGADALADALTRTRALLKNLAPAEPRNESITLAARIKKVHSLVEEYNAARNARDDARTHLATLINASAVLDLLPEMDDPIEMLFCSQRTETLLLRYHETSTLESLHPIFTKKNDAQGTVLVCVLRESGSLEGILKAAHLEQIDLSPLNGRTGTITHVRDKIARERKETEASIATSESRIASLDAGFLRASEYVLALELLKAQAPLRFGSTGRITIITGFVPENACAALEKKLGSSALIEYTQTKNAPTKLDNPHSVQNFEELIRLYTLPSYDEIDPTSIMAVTFPIFFGFMLGDIGYGLCLLGLFMWLKRTYPSIRQLAEIVIISSVSTIVFGALFGEIFGLEQLFGFHLPHIVHRAEDLATMFVVAIVFGIAHLNLGLMLGMHNEARTEGWFHAILKKGSWMPLQAGALLLIGASGMAKSLPIFGSITGPSSLGWILVAIGVIGVVAFEHLQGIFELPMIFSHTLSYVRLVAIGLASVSMAVVVNDLGGGLVAGGGIGIAFGILVIVFGHTLNLALGLLGPFLHSLRLHYAEFFMKFYEGGGTPYVPFGGIPMRGEQ